MKNIPVLRLSKEEENRIFSGEGETLAEKMRWFLEQSGSERLMLSMSGREDPSYGELKTAAAAIARAADEALPEGQPLLVVLEQDIAKALGLRLREELSGRRKVLCIDGIRAEQGDYADLGRPVMDGLVIPVVVKTLLFG